VRRSMLNELSRQLSTIPTHVLGFIVTGAGKEEGYGYGSGYGYGRYSAEPDTHREKGTSKRSAV